MSKPFITFCFNLKSRWASGQHLALMSPKQSLNQVHNTYSKSLLKATLITSMWALVIFFQKHLILFCLHLILLSPFASILNHNERVVNILLWHHQSNLSIKCITLTLNHFWKQHQILQCRLLCYFSRKIWCSIPVCT